MALSVTDVVEQLLPGLTTAEVRIVATAAVVVIAAIAVGLLAPFVVRWAVRFVDRRLLHDPLEQWLSEAADRIPWTVPARWVVRALQVLVVLYAGLGLLVVWGRFHLALWILTLVQRAIPDLVRAVVTVVLVVGTYVGMDLLQDAVDQLASRADRMTEHQEQVVYRVSQVALLATFTLLLLWLWGLNLGGLLVGAGFLGIVVGLAARQTLGAFIAGFVLMLSRPFEIGDWVEIGDQEGIVTDITIVNTRLRNFDGEYVSIPNDRVADSVVVNRTEEGRFRLRIEVGVDYTVDPEHAESVAREAIEEVDVVPNQPQPSVVPTGFGDSAVLLELRFWIDNPSPPRKWRAVRAVIHEVKAAFDEEDIGIPFPQRELSGRSETGGFRVVEAGEPSENAVPDRGDGSSDP